MAILRDRSKVAVNPYKLALQTLRPSQRFDYNPYTRFGTAALRGLHGINTRSGLSGIFDDILNAGENWLQNRIQSSGISGTDIVTIQNQVSQAMDQLSAEYYPLRDSGRATVAIITQYQQAMQTLVNSFCVKARQIGTSRALAGCSTIQYWGGKWIQDREAEKAVIGAGGAVGSTIIDPVTGLPVYHPPATTGITSLFSSQNYLSLLLGAAFVYAMVKSSKRW